MPSMIARLCSLLLAIGLLLGIPQASGATTGATTGPYPPTAAPAATSFFWYSPPLNTNTTPQRISSLAFDPATDGLALAASGNPGDAVQRTTDHGITWSPLEGWNPANTITSYGVTYAGRKQTFVAWGATEVYSSTNGGDSWTPLPYDTNCNQILLLVVHPGEPQTLFASTGNGFARSLNGGQTWSNPSSPDVCAGDPSASSFGVGVSQPNVVYAGTYAGGGVYRSANRGESWQQVNTGLPPDIAGVVPIIQVIADPRNAAVAYALTEQGAVYKTTNSGGQWSPLAAGLPIEPLRTLTLADKHGYRLYGLTSSDIYTLADGTSAWQKLNLPPLPQPSSFLETWRLVVDPFDASRLALFGNNGLLLSMPVPAISALSQQSAPVGSAGFPLIVTGTDFTNATTVQLNGVYRATRFISNTQVETTLYAADLATPGPISVKVGWPGAAASVSNGLPFAVTGSALRINQISPDLATAGDTGLTLTVRGREFTANSKLRWNGAVRTTTVLSSTELTAQISTADLATPGAASVTVADPAPNSRTSNSVAFMVAPQPTPVARRLRPAVAAGPVITMDVTSDGAYVVYTSKQDSAQTTELYAIPVAGGMPRKLNGALPAGESVGYFVLSKDNKYVLYTQLSSVDLSTRLYSVPLAAGPPVRLSAPLATGEIFQYFLVSDDSKRVVYLTLRDFSSPMRNKIYSVPIAGGPVATLHTPQTEDESINFAQISPGGAHVVYSTDTGIQGVDQSFSLHSVPIGGGPSVKLDGPSTGGYDSNAGVTADGNNVVYMRRPKPNAQADLYKIPIIGGTAVKLFDPPFSLFGVSFRLSPDTRYALVSTAALFSVPIDETKPATLLTPSQAVATNVSGFSISPDSRTVVFSAEGLGGTGGTLYSIPIGGGALTQLNNLPNQPLQRAAAPLFSPDGRRVIYVGERNEDPFGADVYSVSIEGGQPPARVSSSRDHERSFPYPQISVTPDSRLVLYRAQHSTDNMFSLYASIADGRAPASSQSALVPMSAGPPALDDPDTSYEITYDSRHVVFLGGQQRESVRDLYISDLPVQQARITPAGGTITFDDGVTLTFPPNAVTTPITVSLAGMPTSLHPTPSGSIAVRGFTLEARNGAGNIVTQFAEPYTLRVSYSDADLVALGVAEAGLNLAFWNGSAWVAVLPCADCTVDAANNTVTVKLNHFTEFSLTAGAHSLFLPLVRR